MQILRNAVHLMIQLEEKIMLKPNQLISPVLILATGFVLGLSAANYFVAPANMDKNIATATPLTEPAEIVQTPALPAASNEPIKPVSNIRPQMKDNVSINLPSEHISLLKTVDVSRQETLTTEPSAEELARNPPAVRTDLPLSHQEVQNLERKLRLESENTVQIQRQLPPHIQQDGNAGLAGHEVL